MTLRLGYESASGLVQPMLSTQNRGISPEKRGCPLGMARGTLLPILQSPALADARLFKRRSYVREAIALWGTAPSARLTSISSLGRFLENPAGGFGHGGGA